MSETPSQQWYFDASTGEVSPGKKEAWTGRMGPYPTREEAEKALELARERTRAADEAEKAEQVAEESWGVPASWDK